MRRHSSFSPEHQPGSTYTNYQNDIPSNHRNSSNGEQFNPVHCEPCRCKGQKKNNYERCRNDLDDQTKQILSSLRQKACRFIRSDLENTTSSETSSKPCMHRHSSNHHHHSNQSKEDSAIRRTQDSIDYPPESEFLRKMKGPCQCIHANQRRESFSSNGNEGNGPRNGYCEECIEKSNQVLKLLEQLKYIRMNLPFHNMSECEGNEQSMQQEIDASGLYNIVKTCRSVVDDLKAALASIRPFTKEDGLESGEKISPRSRDGSRANSKHSKKTTGKSQHVSRAKKRVKGTRGKKKKKSKEVEKRQSREYFEPSLKMPHENCCERCWSSDSRYASPARSPVNKPDQRYNPKFRMTASYEDLLANELEGGDEIPPEMYENQMQQQQIQQQANDRQMTGSPVVVSRSPDQGRGSTKVKNLLLESSDTERPQIRYQIEKRREDYDNYRSPESFEREERRLRPKTHPTGSKERTEAKARTSNLPTDSSARSTRYDPYFNSPRLREKNFDASGSPMRMQRQSGGKADNFGPAAIKSPRDRTQFESNGNGRFDWDTTSTAYQSLERGRTSPPLSGREGHPFVECVCNSGNKTYTVRPTNPSPYPQSFYRSPTRQELLPPSNTHSSVSVQHKSRSPVGKRPQTADYDTRRKVRSSPLKTKETSQGHQCKSCDCRKSSPRPREISLEEPVMKKNLCCHCRFFDNGQESISPFARNTYMQSSAIKQRPAMYQPQMNLNEISFPAKVNYEPCKCNPNLAREKEFFENEIMRGHTGKKIPCPYEGEESDHDFLKRKKSSGNRCRFKEDETYSLGERRDQNDCYHCIPKKYCVFYMTKCKSDHGNVEVLVEELTEKAKVNSQKDSKTTELKDKMKKIDDSQLESMALKFQKGMNSSAKTPENGRILYF